MMFDPINALKTSVGAFGSVITTAWTKIKSWFTGEGPLSSVLSMIKEAFDAALQGLKGTLRERPLVGIATVAGVALVIVLVGPKLIVSGVLNIARQAARLIVGLPRTLLGAVKSGLRDYKYGPKLTPEQWYAKNGWA